MLSFMIFLPFSFFQLRVAEDMMMTSSDFMKSKPIQLASKTLKVGVFKIYGEQFFEFVSGENNYLFPSSVKSNDLGVVLILCDCVVYI